MYQKKCMFGSQWVKFNMNKVSGTESNTWNNPTSERSGIVTISYDRISVLLNLKIGCELKGLPGNK